MRNSFVLLLNLVCCYCYGLHSPVTMLKDVTSDVIQELKKGDVKNFKDVTRVVNKYLLPHVALKTMARSALGRRAWKSATEQERSSFTKEFSRLVIQTYGAALKQYTDEKIEFFPLRGGYIAKRRVRIESIIRRTKGPDIPMAYRLLVKNKRWYVYDISVEGVSLLHNFREQFAYELNNKTLTQLITHLHKHNNKGS